MIREQRERKCQGESRGRMGIGCLDGPCGAHTPNELRGYPVRVASVRKCVGAGVIDQEIAGIAPTHKFSHGDIETTVAVGVRLRLIGKSDVVTGGK